MSGYIATIRSSETSQAVEVPAGDSRPIEVPAGDSLLKAAQQSGIDIVATCGGRGRCRSCRIKLVSGIPPEPTVGDRSQLSEDEIREGYRLSCQCLLSGDVTVSIAPPMNETSFQILVEPGMLDVAHVAVLDSGISKTYLRPVRPWAETGKTSEIDELAGGSGQDAITTFSLDAVRRIPAMLNDLGEGITVARNGSRLISIEPGNSASQMFGLAFDIGTTTVVGYLIDLHTGETVASVSGLNPQTVFGGDLMSRIAFATERPSNVKKLHSRIVTFLNDLSKEACEAAGVLPEHVYKAVVVGNTCMHHLLLGIDPSSVGHAPYLPIIRRAYSCPAREAGLRLNREARLHLLPLIAGFVGADTVAMILSTRMETRTGICIAADIGTNAEIVLSGPDGIVACSCPAGPAFEGGQIHDGMRAALGAIDKVSVDDDIRVHTIGGVPALGICGTGLIDAVAALLDVGIIAPSGRLLVDPKTPLSESLRARLRNGADNTPEFVLVWAKDSANRTDIIISQGDIRQLQLAKAAIKGGVLALLEHVGLDKNDVSEFMIAGGFGNYLNIDSVRRIGLIPDFRTEGIRYVSNAAGLGAQMALVSEVERAHAEILAESISHISLGGYSKFQKIYLEAMGFPEKCAR